MSRQRSSALSVLVTPDNSICYRESQLSSVLVSSFFPLLVGLRKHQKQYYKDFCSWAIVALVKTACGSQCSSPLFVFYF